MKPGGKDGKLYAIEDGEEIKVSIDQFFPIVHQNLVIEPIYCFHIIPLMQIHTIIWDNKEVINI